MLPSPLPDDPRKWDGWNRFNSPDVYERLGLSYDTLPTNEEIEENTRQLLVWWQKKLPLKNQPSNPLAQLLRVGIDSAPKYLAEARAELLNPERRKQIDLVLRDRARVNALGEFKKFLDFALTDRVLTADAEANLEKLGRDMGLSGGDIAGTILVGLKRTGSLRESELTAVEVVAAPALAPAPIPPPAEPVAAAPIASGNGHGNSEPPRTRRVRASSPRNDFERMLRLSGLDEESMSDDRRDTFIDMAENLGLDPGEAEDMVDDYLESVTNGTFAQTVAATSPLAGNRPPVTPSLGANKAKPAVASRTPVIAPAGRNGGAQVTTKLPAVELPPPRLLTPEQEKAQFPDFVSTVGNQMLFIPSVTYVMGSVSPDAPGNEQPSTRVSLSRYFLSRHPVTNAEYEKFDPAHKVRRGSWADDRHPVIYVSYLDATKFCQWLSGKERKRFRLPTEAEWEWAAKGADASTYPWGEQTGLGTLANFADANTTFPWRDTQVNDGYAETSPVGNYLGGVSPFGMDDLAGNVWEWCLDFYDAYKGGEKNNPRGPQHGSQRVYRGGSWKSRFASLKTTARGYNLPTYASNDVGFRIVCECD